MNWTELATYKLNSGSSALNWSLNFILHRYLVPAMKLEQIEGMKGVGLPCRYIYGEILVIITVFIFLGVHLHPLVPR